MDNRGSKKYDDRIMLTKRKDIEVLLKSSPVDDIYLLTGIDKVKLYSISRQLKNEYVNTHSNLIANHNPTPESYRKEEIRKQMWEMYTEQGSTHGMTQKEIADKLGLTRECVSYSIARYKKEHPEIIDVTQMYQPRHLGKEKTAKRNELKAKVARAYEAKIPISEIAKRSKTTVETIKKYLIEDGLYVAHGKTSDNPKKYMDSVIEAKVGYEKKGQFAEVKLNNRNVETIFRGATAELLDREGAGSYTEDRRNRNILRTKILENQHNTMAMLRNNPEALEEFINTDGNASMIILAQKELQKRLSMEKDSLVKEDLDEVEELENI